jgi:protein involved in polysaccharide export with SLBB domain
MRIFFRTFLVISQILSFVFIIFSQITIPDSVLSQRFFDPENLIHQGDLIDVDFIGSTEFDWRGSINPEGFLDGIGFAKNPVNALCRSEELVAADIANLFADTLRNPKVVVKIIDRSNRSLAYIYGAIMHPQKLKLKRKIRLNELVVLSGGITEKFSGEIQIIRPSKVTCESNSNDETEVLNIKIADLLRGNEESNPFLRLGDIITFREAESIYVTGGVLNPKEVSFREKLTLGRAIATAGGLSANVILKRITIFRRTNGVSETIVVDSSLIISKKFEDIELQKYDIIEISSNLDSNSLPPIVRGFGEKRSENANLPVRIIE